MHASRITLKQRCTDRPNHMHCAIKLSVCDDSPLYLCRCGVEYVCFGNHETDIPHTELLRRIQQSNFKWINSNMPVSALNNV